MISLHGSYTNLLGFVMGRWLARTPSKGRARVDALSSESQHNFADGSFACSCVAREEGGGERHLNHSLKPEPKPNST